MADSYQDPGVKRDLGPTDGLLNNRDRLDYDENEPEITERTGLLRTSHSDASTLIDPGNSQRDDGVDVEAAREQHVEHTHWLARVVRSIISLLTTMMAGILTVLQLWILIAFLFIPLR